MQRHCVHHSFVSWSFGEKLDYAQCGEFNIFANFTYGIEMLSLKVPLPCFGLQTFGIYVPVFEINLWIFHNV